MIPKTIIAGAVALPLALLTSQAFAGPCSQDIAVLDKQMTQMGVDPAAKANAASTGSTNTSGNSSDAGMPPQVFRPPRA